MKFLDETGLSYFLDKLKTFIKGKYVGINDPITITDENGGGTSITKDGIRFSNSTEDVISIDADGLTLGDSNTGNGYLIVPDKNGVGMAIGSNYFMLDSNTNSFSVEASAVGGYFTVVGRDPKIGIPFQLDFNAKSGNFSIGNIDEQSRISPTKIETTKFIKKDGTSSQFLMADGSVAEFNKANGVPRLNASGKIDSSQVDALTNAEIDAIVI